MPSPSPSPFDPRPRRWSDYLSACRQSEKGETKKGQSNRENSIDMVKSVSSRDPSHRPRYLPELEQIEDAQHPEVSAYKDKTGCIFIAYTPPRQSVFDNLNDVHSERVFNRAHDVFSKIKSNGHFKGCPKVTHIGGHGSHISNFVARRMSTLPGPPSEFVCSNC